MNNENKSVYIRKIVCFALLFCFLQISLVAQTEPPDALRLYRNGRDLDAKGRFEDAKKAYKKAIDICKGELKVSPQNMDSYAVYTWCLFRLGQYNETITVCNKALKIKNDPRILETLGEAYFYIDNYKESLRCMENYIDMAPSGDRVSVAFFYIAEIYRLTQRYHKADISYSASVYLEPANPLWWYRLGLARENAGEKETALIAYKKAVSLRPEYKEAQKGVQRLQN